MLPFGKVVAVILASIPLLPHGIPWFVGLRFADNKTPTIIRDIGKV